MLPDMRGVTPENFFKRTRKEFPNRFAGKVAVVTGGTSGIGKAIVEELCREGAAVTFTGRNAETGKAVEDEFRAKGYKVLYLSGDMMDEAFCKKVADDTAATFGRIDYLVNNAFRFIDKGLDSTGEDWKNVLFTGPVAYARMIQNCVPYMQKVGGGSIVNMSSISAHIAQPARWTYNTSKGAINMLTKDAAIDLAPMNIRVNTISPGTVWTRETLRGVWEATEEGRIKFFNELNRRQMLERCAEPVEIAGPVLFLLSDDASFITGNEILVDGGYVNMGQQGVVETALIQDGETLAKNKEK